MSVRTGHQWYCGPPGSYTEAHLKRIAGRWIACPGCTVDAFEAGNCHTVRIIDEFRRKFPDLVAPKFVSVCTKTVEGNGGLRDVLVTRDAVFAGCKPPRAAPTVRALGVSLPASIFGNPEVQKRLDDSKTKARETKEAKKRAAKYGKSAANCDELTVRYDLPVRTIEEAEAERRACFERAWAQKREREAAEAKGEAYVPEWAKKQRKQAKDAIGAAEEEEAKKRLVALQEGEARAAAVTAALNRRTDSDEDSD